MSAHDLHHVILRYFNVAGADPRGRTRQSSRGATHLIKVAVETALGLRPKLEVFGADYPTAWGGCCKSGSPELCNDVSQENMLKDYISPSDGPGACCNADFFGQRVLPRLPGTDLN
jgi:hypothetical protein